MYYKVPLRDCGWLDTPGVSQAEKEGITQQEAFVPSYQLPYILLLLCSYVARRGKNEKQEEKKYFETYLVPGLPMETRSTKKKSFKYIAFQRTAEKCPRTAAVGKKRRRVCLSVCFSQRLQAAHLFFWLQIVNTLIEISSCDDRRSIST